jgi:predicted DNA-binding ribbon-helix-helix protein
MAGIVDLIAKGRVPVRGGEVGFGPRPRTVGVMAGEPAMWEALEEICRREGQTISSICAFIESQRRGSSRTAAVRVFILRYFRAAATESGHLAAGHGRTRRLVARNAMLANT